MEQAPESENTFFNHNSKSLLEVAPSDAAQEGPVAEPDDQPSSAEEPDEGRPKRPKRKAARGLPQSIIDDEYESPSPKKSSRKQNGFTSRLSRGGRVRNADVESPCVSTAVAVQIIPDIFDDVMEVLSRSNENVRYRDDSFPFVFSSSFLRACV